MINLIKVGFWPVMTLSALLLLVFQIGFMAGAWRYTTTKMLADALETHSTALDRNSDACAGIRGQTP